MKLGRVSTLKCFMETPQKTLRCNLSLFFRERVFICLVFKEFLVLRQSQISTESFACCRHYGMIGRAQKKKKPNSNSMSGTDT